MLEVVDIIFLLLVLAGLAVGFRAGALSVVGLVCGLVAGAAATPWLLPLIAAELPETGWRSTIVIGAAVLVLVLGATAGASIGRFIRRGADRIRLRPLERLLGGALGLLAAVASVSLIGSAVASSGIPTVSSAVASSSVLRFIDRVTPDPVTAAMARLHSAVLGDTVLPAINGLIDDDLLLAAPDPAQIDTDDPALAAAAASVARISGIAYGCGTASTGSGFVAAPGRIITNAHVVAGVETPLVELPGEPARDGRIVYFDPVDDLAVVAADVDAAPLPLDDTLVPGGVGAVQGYPHGGPFRTAPAGVLASGSSTVPDIYGGGGAPRSMLTLDADIEPGNSGGPLLTQQGAVAGVVFARDTVRPGIGYAMALSELLPVLASLDATAEPAAVPSGHCTG